MREQQVAITPSLFIAPENSLERIEGCTRVERVWSKVVRLEVSDAVGGLEPSRCYIIHGDSVSTC